MNKSILSLICPTLVGSKLPARACNQEWVKVGQICGKPVNLYQINSYKKVGQVGQNGLTHFSDFNSLPVKELRSQHKSGSAFPEGESGKKSISFRKEELAYEKR